MTQQIPRGVVAFFIACPKRVKQGDAVPLARACRDGIKQMKNKQARTRKALALSCALLGSTCLSTAYGFSDGFAGGGDSCQPCHNSGTVEQISITGPSQVPVDSTHTLTLVIVGGPAVEGGLNVAVSDGGGTLGADDVLTGISDGELIHTSPKAFSGDTVSWDFLWTAPSTPGSVQLFGAGVSANDADGAGGDFEGATIFNIQVVPIPAAAVLFASGLALLGWARRWSRR